MGRGDGAPRVGGQAVIEGVMMRVGDVACVAVRRRDGAIETEAVSVPAWAGRVERVPVLRGVAALAASLSSGVRALLWSEGASGMRPPDKRPLPTPILLALSLSIVIGLVVVLPAASMSLGPGHLGPVAEAVTRVVVLAAYVTLVARRREVQRVFEYHGAEHLVVSAHEAGQALVADEIRDGSVRHPRCGTSFLLAVAAVAALVHPLLPGGSLATQGLARVVAVPVVAGIAYELLTAVGALADRRPGGVAERVLLWPQKFTTRRPDDRQIEVAVAALEGAFALREAATHATPTPDATRTPAEAEVRVAVRGAS